MNLLHVVVVYPITITFFLFRLSFSLSKLYYKLKYSNYICTVFHLVFEQNYRERVVTNVSRTCGLTPFADFSRHKICLNWISEQWALIIKCKYLDCYWLEYNPQLVSNANIVDTLITLTNLWSFHTHCENLAKAWFIHYTWNDHSCEILCLYVVFNKILRLWLQILRLGFTVKY